MTEFGNGCEVFELFERYHDQSFFLI